MTNLHFVGPDLTKPSAFKVAVKVSPDARVAAEDLAPQRAQRTWRKFNTDEEDLLSLSVSSVSSVARSSLRLVNRDFLVNRENFVK